MRRWDQLIDECNRSLGYRLLWIILSALSLLYRIGVRGRCTAYRLGLLRCHRLATQVVSVGNITVGGTGKTPVVLYIARMLRDRGQQVTIISRGYGRKGRDTLSGVVSDGERFHLSPQRAGDEPYLLAQKQVGVPVMVGSDRVRVGREAIVRFSPDVLLLDDGFQHIRLQRDLDIVVVDASNPFGNSRILPRGPLREPMGSLSRAHLFWLTRVDQCPDLPSLRSRLRSVGPKVPMVEAIHRPTRLRDLKKSRELDIQNLREKIIVALSSIGNPGAFEQTLTGLGAAIHPIRFPDHHDYTLEDIQYILRFAQHVGAWAVITTEKDAVRWPEMEEISVTVWVLEIEMEVVRGQDHLSLLYELTVT